MAKPPSINAEQLGAVIDALATTNALMFTMLSAEEERTAMLQLLDRLASTPTKTPLDALRMTVMEATANALREIAAMSAAHRPAETEATS